MVTDHSQQWRKLRNIKVLSIFVFFSSIPGIELFDWVTSHFTKSGNPVVVLSVVYVTLFILVSRKFKAFKCPECGNSFSGNTFSLEAIVDFSDGTCQNCGFILKKPNKKKPTDAIRRAAALNVKNQNEHE